MPNSPSDLRDLDPSSGIRDLAVVGAGPAGLSAAATAARLGLTVTLLDSAPRPGGQIWRRPAPGLRAAPRRPAALARLGQPHALVRHLPLHHVWSAVREEPDLWAVHAVTGDDADGERPVRVTARALLLATGAHERHLPFPGWTLPGVVGAGGAQAMLKGQLVLPGRRVVVAGSGPLLLAVATSLAAAGVRVPAVVEASGYLGYARRPGALAADPRKLAEGARHAAALLRHRVPLRTRSAVTAAHGTDRVEAVTVTRLDDNWRPLPGTSRSIRCDALAVGHGLVPQTDLATTLGCAARRTADGTFALVLDDDLETTVRGVWAAGESAGVGGERVALAEGELAARAVARRLRGGPAVTPALRRRRARLRAFADAMTAVHAPGPGWAGWLTDATEVCRCEEVTAGRVREAVRDLGARDARTVKLLTRAGMGWCQGRTCGQAVARLAAPDGLPTAPERRPLAVPVTLGTLAALDDGIPAKDGTR
ncbi:FAD-dependent oxidoreductase [Streptomyces sp. AV19]|uniref:NAD(P)/FAD-dependent oxidoreductase n=1 Tax=Streptomyces sp. AV19 TaxID=2793068 RepID=UPI0018FE2BD0|nr:NAD(P)/FAD-dependent oxidoreductase [Streptomyces sp. AV19]MBH1938117.1 FAD-dependent oxidoreductase [Streptomyces sp. AV19]MDG4536137.1 FAD-dependent oxidoreductase [Streptomyces sp. AV19]